MAAILSPLGLYGGNRKMNLPLKPNTRIHDPRGTLGNFFIAPSNGCLATTNLLSLDASLAIPMCVHLFEDSGLHRRTQVRPVLLTGQTGTPWSNRSDTSVRPVRYCCTSIFGLRSWLCRSTKEPSGFFVTTGNPTNWGVASANIHS
jgi:hypothetical protein